MEIEHSTGEKKAEFEHTLTVCKEFSYLLTEGLITAEECGEEIRFFPASA